MRRSSASIPTNIAEGCGRGTEADFASYISEVTHQQLEVAVVEVKRMLTAFIQKLCIVS